MRPRHGEIVEPKKRFVTYAHQMDISYEVLHGGGLRVAEHYFINTGKARAFAAATEIDPNCPVIITAGAIIKLPDAPLYCERWGVHIRVEFPRYVYDDTKRLAIEWQKEQIERLRYRP